MPEASLDTLSGAQLQQITDKSCKQARTPGSSAALPPQRVQVAVTASRLELRTDQRGIVGAIPLTAVASFGMSSNMKDCIAVVYRKANRTVACWVLVCASNADAKAALKTLGYACNNRDTIEPPSPMLAFPPTPLQMQPPENYYRAVPMSPGEYGRSSGSKGNSLKHKSKSAANAPNTPTVGASLMDSPAMARRARSVDGGPAAATAAAAAHSKVPRRVASNPDPKAAATVGRSRLYSDSSSKFGQEGQKHTTKAERKAMCNNGPGQGSPGRPSPQYRANTDRPQSMGCAISCAFVGTTNISQVPGQHKDEQARLDTALANAEDGAFDQSKCTKVLITVIGGLLRFRPVEKADASTVAEGSALGRRTMSQTKRSADAAAAARSLEETKILHSAIKFVGHGKKHTSVFAVLIGKAPEFAYYTFVCDNDLEATSSVQALARAFGAGQKMDALLTPMKYTDAVAEGDRLFAASASAESLAAAAAAAADVSQTHRASSLSVSSPNIDAGGTKPKKASSTIFSRPRSTSNASTLPKVIPPVSAAIEIESVQYLGHMEVVSTTVVDLAVKCEDMLGRLVGTSPATIAVRHNLVEFVDPKTKDVAKWFLMSSIEWLHVNDEKVTMVVTRGKLPNLRFFCYSFHTETAAQARQLCKVILTGIKAWRRLVIKQFEDTTSSSGSKKSILHDVLSGSSENEDRLQEVLQHEIDHMKEVYRAITIKRFRLQKPHLKTESEQNRGMLALLLHMYDKCKASDITGKGGFLQKSLNLSSHLASSLESLLMPPESKEKGAKGNRHRTKSSLTTGSPTRGRTSSFGAKGGKVSNSSDNVVDLPVKPFRQAMFKSVTGNAPRRNTPGRRASQAFFMAMEQASAASTNNSRRSLIVERWHKALQQTLMLLRMAKQNARLDAISVENTARAEAKMTAEHEIAVAKQWQPIWSMQPDAWPGNDELRMCIRAGVPAEHRGRLWHGLALRYANTKAKEQSSDQSYLNLLLKPCIYRHAIKIDLGRTFPGDEFFADPAGDGHKSLFNCLTAYSNMDEQVGYCQGMNFFGGMFLFEMNEEDAFMAFSGCMQEHGLRYQYMPDMHQLQVQLYQFTRLLHDLCPTVNHHLTNVVGIEPFLYATPWFLSIFSSIFPREWCRRIFDFLMLDGIIVVFKIACGLLQRHAAAILQEQDFEKALTFLQKTLVLPEYHGTADEVVSLLDEVAVTQAQLDKYETEFELMKEQIPAFTNQDDAVKENATLLDKLMDSEHAKEAALSQLEVVTQQLNAAKTALQSMETELMLAKAESADLRDRLEEATEMSAAAPNEGSANRDSDILTLDEDDWVVQEESNL